MTLARRPRCVRSWTETDFAGDVQSSESAEGTLWRSGEGGSAARIMARWGLVGGGVEAQK